MGSLMVVRKRADKEGSTRIEMNVAGERRLVNPETPGQEHEPWPLLGYELEDAPESCTVPMDWLKRQISEGWVTAEGEDVTFQPGGPEEDPWRVTHTFTHWDSVTFHCYDGDVTYDVTRNADKYEDGSVDWSVGLEMTEDNRG
jgi:hypothetical protein